MPVSRYMELCLTHPEHGYYVKRDPFGVDGDFTTAPEISQMFGELIGLWLLQVWQDQGCPAPFRLVELGPGRGTLLVDALRAARMVPAFGEAADLWLVEASPRLRALQIAKLPQAQWADRLEEVPDGPTLLVANEFFDALPIRQFITGPDEMTEILVGCDPTGALTMGRFEPARGEDGPIGWTEVSPAQEPITREISRRIMQHGGAALVIDYGYRADDRPNGPTLQAVRRHEKVPPLTAPGDCDLTWLVDFDRLSAQLKTSRVTTQGAFLAAIGIGQRAQALAARDSGQTDSIAAALHRLTAPDQMGTLFKVLAAVPETAPPPPGF
ncbi:MAG: class I SAM-dependent methyltransferase [Paracoccaceae bacterium]